MRHHLLFLACTLAVAALLLPAALAEPEPRVRVYRETCRIEVMGIERPGRGFEVGRVTAGGAATRMRDPEDSGRIAQLEVGDLITDVDGCPVYFAADYYECMDEGVANGGRLRLSVVDHRTGERGDWIIQAALVRGSEKPSDTVYRLDADWSTVPGLGLRLVHAANGPLTRMHAPGDTRVTHAARPGDHLVSVDGVDVDTVPELHAALERVWRREGRVTLGLRDQRTWETSYWVARAVRSPQPGLPAPPPPDAHPQNRRWVHVLLCASTGDQKIGPSVAEDLETMRRGLQEVLWREFLGSFEVLRGPDCNRERILRAVDALNVRPDDTLFVYYAGHGGYARQHDDPTGGHYLALEGEDLPRSDLFARMRRKGARLNVLLSDSCNVDLLALPELVLEIVEEQSANDYTGLNRLEELLLTHRGAIDVNSSSWDQYSWSMPGGGGCFTLPLGVAMRSEGPRTWDDFLAGVGTHTNVVYKTLRDGVLANPGRTSERSLRGLRVQREMWPQAFRLDVEPQRYFGPTPPGRTRGGEVRLVWTRPASHSGTSE